MTRIVDHLKQRAVKKISNKTNFILTINHCKHLLDQIVETIKLFKYGDNEREPN